MIKYSRFMAVYLFSLATLTGILLGGAWMWLGFVVIYGVMILGDESLGDYYEEPAYRHPRLLNTLLYFALPALFVLGVAMAWMAGSGDLFGLGAWAQANLGLDLFARREATAPWHWLGAILSAGITFAALGTNIGHELTHRTTDQGAAGRDRQLASHRNQPRYRARHHPRLSLRRCHRIAGG